MQNQISLQNSEELLAKVLLDLKIRNYKGLDPSAIRFSERLLKIVNISEKVLPGNLGRKIVYKLLFLSRDRFVSFLKPKKEVYSKSLGLILSAYVNLARENKITDVEFQHEVKEILTLLDKKKLKDLYLWAHEINYKILDKDITDTTPNLITTAFVALGVYDLAKYTDEKKYKDLYIKIIKNMLKVFPLVHVNEDKACFMYTPITDYHVHNCNLIMAELLAKYQQFDFDADIEEKMILSVRYSLEEFEETNSFYYSGNPTLNKSIDNYHTGYVLRSLNVIVAYLRKENNDTDLVSRISNRIEYGVNFYIKHFIQDNLIIRDHLNTLETHSLAESIIFLMEFDEYLNCKDKDKLLFAINNTLSFLWDSEKEYFIYVSRLRNGKYMKDSTYMVRWSQSWMAYALSLVRLEGMKKQ